MWLHLDENQKKEYSVKNLKIFHSIVSNMQQLEPENFIRSHPFHRYLNHITVHWLPVKCWFDESILLMIHKPLNGLTVQ